MGIEKWMLCNNVECKISWGMQNEPPSTIPNASLHPKKMMYIWWHWKVVLYYELLPENQMINSNKYCSQLDQLKTGFDKKHPELVNRKHIIFHQDNARPHYLWCPGKTVTAWLGSSDSLIVFPRPCTFRFPFILVFKKLS